jgi:predicted small metal-binding protein
MKLFACRDAGYRSCTWEVMGRDDEEVVSKAREHGHEVHGRELADDEVPVIRSLIESV